MNSSSAAKAPAQNAPVAAVPMVQQPAPKAPITTEMEEEYEKAM
jgi:hypothetical protein